MFGITERGDAGLDLSWIGKAHELEGIIAITKAPHRLTELAIPANVIIHCTITGYGGTILEPGVIPWHEEIKAYHRLVNLYGHSRVILRIDPIIPTERGLIRAIQVFKHRESRVRISFFDNYPHVRARFATAKLPILKTEGIHFPLSIRKAAVKHFPDAEVCGEPDLPCQGCISNLDYHAIGLKEPEIQTISTQRKECRCLTTKFELLDKKSQCNHRCLYCYWR